jgi:hypothetical protein
MAEFVTHIRTFLDILVRKENENGVQIVQNDMFIYSFVHCSTGTFLNRKMEVKNNKNR